MGRADYILATAEKALAVNYGIQACSLRDEVEVGNMDYGRYQTIKYSCDTEAGKKLFSVHVLNDGFDCIEASRCFTSQLLWLEALDRDSDVCVQAPVRNDRSELLTLISGTPDILVSLVHWVPGELLEGEDEEESPLPFQQARDMGILLGHLHRHSERWTPPPEFTRPDHPVGQLKVNVARLEPARADKRISANDFAIIQGVAERVESVLRAYGRQGRRWGLLHGDFTASNCVIHEGRLAPIDFDWCCAGNYLGDIARCLLLHETEPQVSQGFLDGYTSIRDLEGDWLGTLEALTLATALWIWSDSVAYKTAFPEMHSFVGREFEKYLGEESFLFAEERTWIL
ncbi:MAG: phosphotransferase [Candidatus Latescibacteria bacterium]|nr:phosphotransferase [Candidatus Latescibacterota bacterium]